MRKRTSRRPSSSLFSTTLTVAKYADACLVFVNADSGGRSDRNDLLLRHGGDTLIVSTTAVYSNAVVVLHTVGPVLVEAWIDNSDITTVLAAGLAGQDTGNAIVDVLFGAVNPSGRLPYTIAKQRSEYLADVLYNSSVTAPQIMYSEGLNMDYRHFDANNIAPRFELGFGLSYTSVSPSPFFASAWTGAQVFGSSRIQASTFALLPRRCGRASRVLRGFERVLLAARSTVNMD
jgi:beta-glucosidase